MADKQSCSDLIPRGQTRNLVYVVYESTLASSNGLKQEGFDLNSTDHSAKKLITKTKGFEKYQVPIVRITKRKQILHLAPHKNKEGDFRKGQNNLVIAVGKLISFNKERSLEGKISFQGNFKGLFSKSIDISSKQTIYYFQGEITKFTILSIDGKVFTRQQYKKTHNWTSFHGFFKGSFLQKKANVFLDEQNISLLYKLIKQEVKIQYYVPTLVRIDIRKIEQINFKKSSAKISAILKIDIQLNRQVLKHIYDFKQHKFTLKRKLCVDSHRGKPLVLPFYNTEDFDKTDEQAEYEWYDGNEGDFMQMEWSEQLMRMSYRIRGVYTAEIDNSYANFYAPFSLNILKIVLDFHSIKLNSHTKICINCCDLTDSISSDNNSPYIPFQKLQRNMADLTNHQQTYQKHIDRLTKLDTSQFVDHGQFNIANNRLYLFPYHKRVFKNKTKNSVSWTLRLSSRNSLLQTPQVSTHKRGSIKNRFYQTESKVGEVEKKKQKIKQWEFVHIQIPIFKYPVIDMIRIFVPILILSIISMTIFWQENGNDYSGFNKLAARIASGCSLMVTYVALIPMIRSNLPPTPSITLIEILIYFSVVPNLLAICSVLITSGMDTDQFFATYKPWTDCLFLISFIICCLSFFLLAIMMVVYVNQDYKSDFTIYNFRQSGLQSMRAPAFMSYINQLREILSEDEYEINQFAIPYHQFGTH